MSLCDVPVISTTCNAVGGAASDLMSAPFEWLAEAMGAAAKSLVESMWTVIDSTTYVDVTSSGYTRVYNVVFGIAIFAMVGFFVLQVIGGMIRREPAALSRAALGLAKSILGSFVILSLLATALEITDQICLGIVHASGTTMEQLGDRLALLVGGLGATSIAAPGAAAIITLFLATLAIGATFLVWVSLLIRKALLLVAIVFAPIALAGASWDHTRAWVGRWAAFVIALIVSKVVVVVIFLLATVQVAAPIEGDLKSVSQPLGGIVLMLVAGFAPYLAYKAISFMGFDMYHAMSAEQEAKGALNRPVPLPTKPGRVDPPKVLDVGAGSAESGGTWPGRTPSGGSPGAPPAFSPAWGGPGAGGAGSAGAGGAAAGSTAAGGGAAAGLAAGAGAAVGAGRTAGSALGHAATQQDAAGDAAAGPPPASTPPPPQVADPTLDPGRNDNARGDQP